jgi:hypothetical protein
MNMVVQSVIWMGPPSDPPIARFMIRNMSLLNAACSAPSLKTPIFTPSMK